MQIPPSASLLHALSHPARPAGTEPAVPADKAAAARAAARAAFQAAQLQQQEPAAPVTAPKAVDPAPAAEQGRIRPRGSVVNIVI
jgi:hypothetical protein